MLSACARSSLDMNLVHTLMHMIYLSISMSLYIYIAALFRHLKSFDTVQTIDAAEVTPENFPPSHGGLLVLSQVCYAMLSMYIVMEDVMEDVYDLIMSCHGYVRLCYVM